MENRIIARILLLLIITGASLVGLAHLAGTFENVKIVLTIIGVFVCGWLIGKALYWILLEKELEEENEN